MGLKARLRARPQPLSVVNKFNRHSPKMDWKKAVTELRRKQREWEPPHDKWWLEYRRPKPGNTRGPQKAPVVAQPEALAEGEVVAAGLQ